MGQLAIPLMIAGTAVSFISGMQQASAQEEAAAQQQAIYDMQAENARVIAERNALIRSDEAKYSAARDREQAIQEEAAALKKAKETRRQTEYKISAARAAGGASGGTVSDPTVFQIMDNIFETGELEARTNLFEGKSAASLLRSQADLTEYSGQRDAELMRYEGQTQSNLLSYQGDVAKYEGESQASATRMNTIGDAISGGASIASKYKPKTTSSSPSSSVWYAG